MEMLAANWYLLVILAGCLLLPYLLGPILIHQTLKQSDHPQLVPFPHDHPSTPREVAAHFRRVSEALAPLGFEPLTGLTLPRQTPNVKAVLLVLVNRAEKDAALATVFFADTPLGSELKLAYVEIVCRFRDGACVSASNADQMGAFPKRPNYTSAKVPTVQDPAGLYRVHKAMVKRHESASLGKVLRVDEEFRGDAAAYLATAIVEELEAATAAGYMYHAPSQGVYRPTWPGAFIMTLQELWPFKAIRRSRRDRRAQKLLAELEV